MSKLDTAAKEAQLRDLEKAITLHAASKLIPRATASELNLLRERLEFRTRELTREFHERELDIKLDIIGKVAEIYRNL